jgi:hypothetical protein
VQAATFDPADLAYVESELAKNANNGGVGVVDLRTGQVRIFPFNDTRDFSRANPHLLVMEGHEAAAALVGIPLDQARGFALGKPGGQWLIINSSHLNSLDGQANPMRMAPLMFNEIVSALQVGGVQNPVVR